MRQIRHRADKRPMVSNKYGSTTIPGREMKKYTKEEVLQLAWYAVQHSHRLGVNRKFVKKFEIDEFLEQEMSLYEQIEESSTERKTFNAIKFGDCIRERRTLLDISIRDVAKETSVSASTLSRLENGGIPDINTLIAILDWLKLPISEYCQTEDEQRTYRILKAADR
jgi:DNA-binding XRE family transcriptional regulator